jgi:uncharacterized membrane protein
MLYGTIAGIVGGVVAIAVAIAVVLASLTSFLHKVFPAWNGDWTMLAGMTPVTTNITFSDVIPFIIAGLAVFVIIFVFIIIEAVFYRRSLTLLKTKSGIGLFGTTGILLLIGAILTIILIGYLIVWIAILLLAIAFFELRPQPVQPMPPTGQTTMPP